MRVESQPTLVTNLMGPEWVESGLAHRKRKTIVPHSHVLDTIGLVG